MRIATIFRLQVTDRDRHTETELFFAERPSTELALRALAADPFSQNRCGAQRFKTRYRPAFESVGKEIPLGVSLAWREGVFLELEKVAVVLRDS